jgi:hypothetical protein
VSFLLNAGVVIIAIYLFIKAIRDEISENGRLFVWKEHKLTGRTADDFVMDSVFGTGCGSYLIIISGFIILIFILSKFDSFK